MRTSRRVLLCLAATVMVAGCGSRSDESVGAADTTASATAATAAASDADPTTESGETADEAAPSGDSSTDTRLAWVTYEFAGEYPSFATTAPTWTLPGGVEPDPARLMTIAAAFGLTGEVQPFPAEQGDGWFIGSNDFTGDSLRVTRSALLDWYFSPAVGAPETVDIGCALPIESQTTDLTSSAPCAQPAAEAPANVPDAPTAEARARELLTAAGFDLAGYEVEATADEWGAYVSMVPSLDASPGPYELGLSISFGAEGAVTSAWGSLATPVPGDSIDLLGPADAFARLQEQQQAWSDSPLAREGDVGDPAATQEAPAEPMVIRLTEVELGTMVVWPGTQDARVVPTYVFRDADGIEYQVEASVEATVFVVPDTVPVPDEPALAEIPRADAETLLGLSEADAEAAATGYGWAYRVIARDGEEFAVTMDYSGTRVNVRIENGVVTAVSVG